MITPGEEERGVRSVEVEKRKARSKPRRRRVVDKDNKRRIEERRSGKGGK